MRDLASSKEWVEMYGTPRPRRSGDTFHTTFGDDLTVVVENTYDKLDFAERSKFDRACKRLVDAAKAKSPKSQFSLDMAREVLGKIAMAQALIDEKEVKWW